jgi:hypothetical protein
MTLVSRRRILATTACGSVAGLQASVPLLAAEQAPSGAVRMSVDGLVRPEDFGAVADGKADCTQAFLRAIAYATRPNVLAGRQRNWPIQLSTGVYRLTQPIYLSRTDMMVAGAGRQNTLLLIDHSGPGIVCDSGGDLEIRGITIGSSDARKRGKTGDGFVCQPYAGLNFTYFVSIIDVAVNDQPNNGFTIFAPEGLRMENVRSIRNGGDGCLLDASGLQNICNKLDFVRFNNNGGHGLHAINVANSIFSRVECGNNGGECQFRLEGAYNTIAYTDCEGSNTYDGSRPDVGLIISGKANIVQGGDFFKLSTAIQLKGADDCRVIMPKLEGASRLPLLIGVDIGSDCARTTVDFVDGHLTTTRVRDRGINSRITAGGIMPLADASPMAVPQHAAEIIAPDLSTGPTHSLVMDGPLRIEAPIHARPGAIFTLVIDTQAHGVGALSFADAYRGIGEHTAANADHRYLTCAFVATGDGRCLTHSVFSYN